MRGTALTAARALAGAAILVGAAALAGCIPPGVACPAIGYVNTSPVIVRLDPALRADAEVAACLGRDCEAAEAIRTAEGDWQVPQEPPYLSGDVHGIDPADGIRVVVTAADGRVVRDVWMEVPYVSEPSGACAGPIVFQPVLVA